MPKVTHKDPLLIPKVVSYLRLYRLTREKEWLRWAQRVHRFVWSGWDEQLGGGIYWHQSRKSKNTCSNAPALVSALELYALTRDARYLRQAEQIHAWVCQHLRDYSTIRSASGP